MLMRNLFAVAKFLVHRVYVVIPFSSLTQYCWLADNGIDLLVVRFDWSCARLAAPIVTTTAIILSCSKIQNGDILVPECLHSGFYCS